MAGWEQVLDRTERRRLDNVDHDRRRQHRNAPGADKRRRMLRAHQQMGGTGETGCDASKIDHVRPDDVPGSFLANPAADVQLAAGGVARSNAPR